MIYFDYGGEHYRARFVHSQLPEIRLTKTATEVLTRTKIHRGTEVIVEKRVGGRPGVWWKTVAQAYARYNPKDAKAGLPYSKREGRRQAILKLARWEWWDALLTASQAKPPARTRITQEYALGRVTVKEFAATRFDAESEELGSVYVAIFAPGSSDCYAAVPIGGKLVMEAI